MEVYVTVESSAVWQHADSRCRRVCTAAPAVFEPQHAWLAPLQVFCCQLVCIVELLQLSAAVTTTYVVGHVAAPAVSLLLYLRSSAFKYRYIFDISCQASIAAVGQPGPADGMSLQHR
jgi:hypothetical protein